MSTNHHNQIIEHIVLFKVKDDTDPTKIIAMVNDLKGLATLDQVLYLFAGPIHRLRSTTAFTHILHSRYRSKDDLNAYLAHPGHVRVVDEWLPIWEDFMAVDWVAGSVPRTVTRCHGSSVARVTLFKVKENVGEVSKTEIEEVVKERSHGSDHMTMGDNFCMVHTKGFSFASVAYFKDLIGEMEGCNEVVNEKIGGYVDDTIVVEFVV